MKPISLISSDLFDAIRSRFTNLEMGDENGTVTLDSNNARFFDFDFDVEGNNLGRVSISLNEPGNLKIFYSQGILEETSSLVQERWFNFLRKMRKFAKRRLLRFDTRDITKSNLKKEDFKFLANQKKENAMNESAIYGSSLSSFLPLEKTLLIIRHSQPVGLTRGDRSRRIKSIFVQNGEGERFKMPINCLRTARAMQRHCANGGRPYDNIGTMIIKMGSEASQLRDFKRRCKMDSMQETAHTIVQTALEKYESLKEQLESMCSQRGYENFKSNAKDYNGVDEVLIDESTLQQYREKFSQVVFREDLSQYFPLLEKIMREAGEIDLTQLTNEQVSLEAEEPTEPKDDFEKFEKWANDTEEGFLSDDVIKELKEYLSPEPEVGVDGTDAINALKNIFNGEIDDDLEKRIKEVAPSGDTKTIVISWLSSRDDASAIKELNEEPPTEDEPEEEEIPTEEPSPTEEPASVPAAPETPMQPTVPVSTVTPPVQPTAESVKPNRRKIKKIAEMVKSFYNRDAAKQEGLGPWTIGETAVKRKVKKKFGKSAAKLAEQLINELTERHNQKAMEKDAAFEDILRLSGIKK